MKFIRISKTGKMLLMTMVQLRALTMLASKFNRNSIMRSSKQRPPSKRISRPGLMFGHVRRMPRAADWFTLFSWLSSVRKDDRCCLALSKMPQSVHTEPIFWMELERVRRMLGC